jgi:hypothetical protein
VESVDLHTYLHLAHQAEGRLPRDEAGRRIAAASPCVAAVSRQELVVRTGFDDGSAVQRGSGPPHGSWTAGVRHDRASLEQLSQRLTVTRRSDAVERARGLVENQGYEDPSGLPARWRALDVNPASFN